MQSKLQLIDVEELYTSLNDLKLLKQTALQNWALLLQHNQHERLFTYHTLQKLWMKLLKKYKFKLTDWQQISDVNMHKFFLDEEAHGFQGLLRFYHDRHLAHWREDLFQYGFYELLHKRNFANLEIFFLTQAICEVWQTPYTELTAFHTYFKRPLFSKTQQFYEAYMRYRTVPLDGLDLYRHLSYFNPHYKIEAKQTPQFYKDLHNSISPNLT